MVAPMDAELSRGVGIGPLFDVLYVGPVDSDRDVMLGLAGYRASMATNASLVVYHESVVRHYGCDTKSTQNASVSAK